MFSVCFAEDDALSRSVTPSPLETVLDAISLLKSTTSLRQVRDVVGAASGSYGFQYFCMTGVPPTDGPLRPLVRIDAWPKGWGEHYSGRSYQRLDPVIAHLRRANGPFRWSEAQRAHRSPEGDRLMDEAATDWKLVEGLTVPIRKASGDLAAITFGAEGRDVDPRGDVALHVLSVYAELQVCELLTAATQPSASPPALTSREIECLQWAAAGKTVWEISVILTLSERTARFHLDSAARKLGARNKAHAIAEALRRGLIE